MRSLIRNRVKTICGLFVVIAFVGCVAQPGGDETADATQTLSAVLPTATALPSPTPTEIVREFVTYTHRSGVFSINYPRDWEVLDESTDQQLQVRFLPPIGFGSRVIVDATNEGQFSPDQLEGRLESYLRLHYSGNLAYTEVSREALPDSRLQVLFLYDDGAGGRGQETVVAQQAGSLFVVLRIFLADSDTSHLASTLSTMAGTLAVDPRAAWGTSVAAINPAELLLTNTFLWRDRAGLTYYMGEVYNASPSDVSAIQVRVAVCDENGVVLVETTGDAGLSRIGQGGLVPFAFVFENMPRDLSICSEQAIADPARADSTYTTDLVIQSTSGLTPRRQLRIQGTVSNPSLEPVANVRIILVVYDASGRVIGYKLLELGADVYIEPGQAYTLDHTFETLGGQADRYVVLVEARISSITSPSLNPGGQP